MTQGCRQKTRYIDGLLVASGTAFHEDHPVIFDGPAPTRYLYTTTPDDAEVHIATLPDGAEIRIAANPHLGTPEITRPLDTKATLGRKGRKGFAAAVSSITDPSQRAAYLAVALGGVQTKLENVGRYGADVLRAIYAEAGVGTLGRTIVVDEGFPHQEDRFAFNDIIESSAVDPAIRRVLMQVLLNKPASGYLGTRDGADEAYQADRMERDISRIQTETELAAAAMHDAWRAPRLLPDGTYEPRIKDVEVYDGAGTTSVDIANTAYADLPAQWQAENHAAATAVVRAIEADPTADIEDLADIVHRDWLTRNAEWAEPSQLLPYDQLPETEKQKDREVVLTAMAARTAAAVETTRSWVTDEDLRFFDGHAGFRQTQDLATVAMDTHLPIDIRTAAADRLFESPHGDAAEMACGRQRDTVPTNDPVLADLDARFAERDRLKLERLRGVFGVTPPPARGAHLTRTDTDTDTPTVRPDQGAGSTWRTVGRG